MSQSSFLEEFLPTKLSRWIAGLTMPSAIAVSSLPLFQPLSQLVKAGTETHLFQGLLLISTLLLGTLTCLISVARAFNKWETIERTHELKEIFFDVRFYVRKGLTDEEQMMAEWACTNCWADKRKSIIHKKGSEGNITTYFCPKCKTEFKWDRHISTQPVIFTQADKPKKKSGKKNSRAEQANQPDQQ